MISEEFDPQFQLSTHFSNRIEFLLKKLRNHLFTKTSPFAKRWIIVSSPFMKSWLMWQLASDEKLGIATGIEVYYLNQVITKLGEHFLHPSLIHMPSTTEIALAIEQQIKQVMSSFSSVSEEEQQLWLPLFRYLQLDFAHMESKPISKKNERRLISLSEQVAQLFFQYGIYGGKMVAQWGSPSGWQGCLWNRLFVEKEWPYFYKAMQSFFDSDLPQVPKDLQIEIFGLNFISAAHHQFFVSISQKIPIRYYMLSPCEGFWSDMLSDREANRWKQKLEFSELLTEHFGNRHPLLANWGRLGRKMAQQIEESESLTESYFELPEGVLAYPDYETGDVAIQNTGHALSLLEAVQADMVALRNMEKDPLNVGDSDDSIQIHQASSSMREVQIVYDLLLSLMDRHAEDSAPICPRDILVMAPDIMEYHAAIQTVFGDQESRLDFQLFDLKMHTQNSLAQGFLHLLGLCKGRWDAPSLMQLMEYPEVQRRHHFTQDDLGQFRYWIRKVDIRWGYNDSHRNDLLHRDACFNGLVENSSPGTWDEGFGRLLLGLAMKEDVSLNHQALPIEYIDANQGVLLGKWIHFLKSLKEDLKPLQDGTQFTLEEWSCYLKCLCEAYFAVEPSKTKDYEDFIQHLQNVEAPSRFLADAKFGWETIQHHLMAALEQQTVSYREGHLQAVRFCSMLPMRAIPSQIIVLLGMNEGAFPKRKQVNSLDLMKESRVADYCPSNTDYDRYLFLEALLSCRRYLLISYAEDHPSLLVSELYSYLDRAFRIQGSLPSEKLYKKHPFDAFNYRYFLKDSSEFTSFSKMYYQQACAFYHREKIPPYQFFPEFSSSRPIVLKAPPFQEKKVVLIKQLNEMIKDPVRGYFHQTLDMRLDLCERHKLKAEEDFILDHLEYYQLKKSALAQPLNQVLESAQKKGKLPSGVFKKILKTQLEKDAAELQDHLKIFGITAQDIFTIELQENCLEPVQVSDDKWVAPAIEVNGVWIKGTLEELTKQGLLLHGKDSFVDRIKCWPQYLIFQVLVTKHQCFAKIPTQMLFLKSGQMKSMTLDEPMKLLSYYLDYYFLCLNHLSPMIPEWISDVLKGEPQRWRETVQKNLKSHAQHFFHEELIWSLDSNHLGMINEELFEVWKEAIDRAFHPMMEVLNHESV